VSIKGTSKATYSNESGAYQIKNVKPGAYTLVATFIGLEKKELPVTVIANAITTLDFVLKENSSQLQEVIVSTKRNKNNTIVAKMPLKDLENPQVYNSVPVEILKQQNITTYDDALRNVPGISRTWESTGRAGDGGAYFSLRGFDAQPALTNGLPGLTAGNLDVANVEEIQVIKGPSATLFGGSFFSYGGIINTITKKPYYNKFGGEVAYNTGSFGLHRVSVDVNTPLSKTEKIALRINTAYHTENTFQDAGFKKSFFIAPTLSYEANDKLSFNVMAEILQEKRAVAPVFFNSNRVDPLDYHNIAELNLNNKLSFTSDDLTIKNPRTNIQAQALYKFAEEWSSQTVFSYGRVRSDGIYSYIWDDEPHDIYFDQYFHNEAQTTNSIDVQQNFNGDFHIGKLRNRLLVGFDHYRRHLTDKGNPWVNGRRVTPQGAVTTRVAYDENDNRIELPAIELTRAAVNQLAAQQEAFPSDLSNSATSAYLSDVINLTPTLMAMLSARVDYFDSNGDKDVEGDGFDQFAVSPKLGLLYQPVKDKVSIFANYMNAFINVEPNVIYDDDGNKLRVESFKPEHANQWEFGVKTNLFDGKLSATASYYDIRVSDRVNYTPTGPVQSGKVGSKGYELDLNANPLPGLNVIAGYSHNDAKVIEGNGNDFYAEVGSPAGGQGPGDQVNLWATYKFERGTLKNFGVGIGGNYASKYRVIKNSVVGVFDLPSYTLLNGSVFYNASKYRVTFNLNNITDEEYYIGYWSVNPQRPRAFALSVAYKF
jgi:iron complex outermembrane receptor protein